MLCENEAGSEFRHEPRGDSTMREPFGFPPCPHGNNPLISSQELRSALLTAARGLVDLRWSKGGRPKLEADGNTPSREPLEPDAERTGTKETMVHTGLHCTSSTCGEWSQVDVSYLWKEEERAPCPVPPPSWHPSATATHTPAVSTKGCTEPMPTTCTLSPLTWGRYGLLGLEQLLQRLDREPERKTRTESIGVSPVSPINKQGYLWLTMYAFALCFRPM